MTTPILSHSDSENNPITPTQLDAWRRMSEDELEDVKRASTDEDVVAICNQLIFIKRYEREISKCWDKINPIMQGRSPRTMREAAAGELCGYCKARPAIKMEIDLDGLPVAVCAVCQDDAPPAQPAAPALTPADDAHFAAVADEQRIVDDVRRLAEWTSVDSWHVKQLLAIIDRLSAPQPAAPLTQVKWWYDTLDSAPYPENRYGDLSNMACGPFDSQAAALTDQAKRQSAAPDYRRARGALAALDTPAQEATEATDKPKLSAAEYYQLDAMQVFDLNVARVRNNSPEKYAMMLDLEKRGLVLRHNKPWESWTLSDAGREAIQKRIQPQPRPVQGVKLSRAMHAALAAYANPDYIIDDTTIYRKANHAYVRKMELRTQQALYKRGLIESDGRKYVISAAGRAALAADEAR